MKREPKGHSQAPYPGATSSNDPYVPGHGNGGYRVSRYELDLEYRVSSNRLAGKATLFAVATHPLSRFTLDLATPFKVARVSVNRARAAKYALKANKLTVTPAKPIEAGQPFHIDVAYSGNPVPLRGNWGAVGWEELTNGALATNQPYGAPSWFPCNDTLTDKASYEIAVTTDSPYAVMANGVLTDRTTRSSLTRWVFDQVEPMSTYLASVTIGQSEFVKMPGTKVKQRAIVPPSLLAPFKHDFARQDRMMSLFIELFGPYPFSRYAVVVTDDELEIPLEAQGFSIFGRNHVTGARDWAEERLVAHELAHQWFGNSLTISSWSDIWLNEGFACYAEWLASERLGRESAHEMAVRYHARLSALPQDLVLAAPGRELMFDDRVYKRGALLLHALRRELGDAAFFEAVRAWCARHRHGLVSTESFEAHMERCAPASLRAFFTAWLHEAALPPLG
ncbi:M1 family metallopeptidase [Micrococcales bacterium 31B]|nr:M1 family metallopeptidase [Micrococcales bacterium 31B]